MNYIMLHQGAEAGRNIAQKKEGKSLNLVLEYFFQLVKSDQIWSKVIGQLKSQVNQHINH